MKSLHCLGLMVLAAATLYGVPPTTGTQWWSTTPIDCSSVDNVAAGSSYQVTLPGGGTGYYCYVSGTFVWLAAGGGYVTSLRVAGPASLTPTVGVAVDYTLYDTNGNNLSLDTTSTCSPSPASGNEVICVLKANQPAELDLLGVPGEAPSYPTLKDGSVFAQFYCPDPITCLSVQPQLIYSAPPFISLSVPIAWDGLQWTQWSVQGIDDGGAHRVSLVIYNQGSVPTIYTVRVYDSTGARVGIGTTPAVPGYSTVTGEAGTYGFLLSDVIKTTLPTGVFKVLVDGGANKSSVMALQVNGRAIATMQVSYDSAPSASAAAIPALQPNTVPHQVSGPRQR
jgi:hypothetical protein